LLTFCPVNVFWTQSLGADDAVVLSSVVEKRLD